MDLNKCKEGTFVFDNSKISDMFKDIVAPREIFVVFDSLKDADREMRRFVSACFSSISRVDYARRIVEISYHKYRFVSRSNLDVILKGRHQTEVIWGDEFKRTLDIFEDNLKRRKL